MLNRIKVITSMSALTTIKIYGGEQNDKTTLTYPAVEAAAYNVQNVSTESSDLTV